MVRNTILAAAMAATVVFAIDNGKGITPPMGWRSWNLYGGNVYQELIASQMDGITSRKRSVNNVPTSLSDLGFKDVGLDDNWQACGKYGPNGNTYHNADGFPMVNTERFPDMINLTSYAHSLGLTAGWYHNNCICSDHCSDPNCYLGDVTAIIEFGWDSVKLDGCGAQRDLDQWAALFNASGKSILMENCHWGGTVPNATWCPWNYFRTSGDIEASYASMVGNLQTTIQWAKSGLSQPGCWAYPDMLEVGVAPGVHPGEPGLSVIESRSHFGAWCIVSSPLILSHDLNNDTLTDAIWPIISNTEAIAVNQNWFGFSGSVFQQPSEMITLGEGYEAVPIWQYWYKPMNSTATAVLLMNHDSVTHQLSLNFSTIPAAPCTTCNVRDIWQQQNLGSFTNTWTTTINSHDSAFLMITA